MSGMELQGLQKAFEKYLSQSHCTKSHCTKNAVKAPVKAKFKAMKELLSGSDVGKSHYQYHGSLTTPGIIMTIYQ